MKDQVNGRLKQVLADALELNPDTITEETSYESVPAWDSLGILKVVMTVESEFGIRVTADEAIEFTSVKAIRQIVSQKLASRETSN